MSEREKIKQEIAYYTALIENHKKTANTSSQSHSIKPEPNTFSNSHVKSSSSTSQQKRSVMSTNSKSGSALAGRRTVVKPQTSNSGRTVVPPAKLSGSITLHTDPPTSQQRKDNSRRTVVVTNPSASKTVSQGSVVGGSPVGSVAGGSSARTYVVNRQASQRSVVNRYSSQGSSQNSQFVWVNRKNEMAPSQVTTPIISTKHKLVNSTSSVTSSKKFKSSNSNRTVSVLRSDKVNYDVKPTDAANSTRSTQLEASRPSSGRKTVVKSRYKLVKKPANSASSSKQVKPSITNNSSKLTNETSPRLKRISKYKLVKNESFDVRQRRQIRNSPYLSKSGKRIITRYKIRRKSSELRSPFRKDYGSSPRLRSSRGGAAVSRFRVDRRTKTSPYKVDKLTYARRLSASGQYTVTPLRKSPYKWRNASHQPMGTFVSRYALQRQEKTRDFSLRPAVKTGAVRHIAGRALQKSVALSLRAKYRKNNTNDKHCIFYMRFGKCNRGDKCFYIHDPDRIAVCTRYLRGTCTIENCPFSHEARREKVPVCQHFLRGCCIRDGCPYLHVNVGRDAPICKNFAQHRYCHLGEKCKKLHTDVCPERNDSGSCPKGRRCKLRHPKKLTRSELLSHAKQRGSHAKQRDSTQPPNSSAPSGSSSAEPHKSQQPQRESTGPVIAAGEKLTDTLPAYISLSVSTPTHKSETPPTQKPEIPPTHKPAVTNTAGHLFTDLRSTKLKTKPSFLE